MLIAMILMGPDLLLENHLFYCVVVGGSSDRTCCSYGSDLRDP